MRRVARAVKTFRGFELTLNYYVLPFNPSLRMRSWRNCFARLKILAAKARENSSKRLLPTLCTASQLLYQNFARAIKRSRRLHGLFQSSLPLCSSFFYNILYGDSKTLVQHQEEEPESCPIQYGGGLCKYVCDPVKEPNFSYGLCSEGKVCCYKGFGR